MNGKAEVGVIGDWVEALGTVIAAIGTTPYFIIEEFDALEGTYPDHVQKVIDYLKKDYGLWGNFFQASGNVIDASTAEPGTLAQFGPEVGASGNVTVIASLQDDLSFDEEQALFILGNALQAVGSLISASLDFEQNGQLAFYQGFSEVLEAIGNALQILGALRFYDDDIEGGRILIYYGSWIQATGAVFDAIFATIALEQQNKSKAEDNDGCECDETEGNTKV